MNINNIFLHKITITKCTLHQPRHMRVLTWLDPNLTHGATVSKGKGMLAEGEDLWSVPTA